MKDEIGILGAGAMVARIDNLYRSLSPARDRARKAGGSAGGKRKIKRKKKEWDQCVMA
jgi:hypothetical protein